VEAGSAFIGAAQGGGGTLDLASGTGTISNFAGETLTVSGSMAPATFSDFDTVDVEAGATFTDTGEVTIGAGQGVIVAGNLTLGAASGKGAVTIAGGTLDLISSSAKNVTFNKTGVLELTQSQGYTGAITAFSKTGGTSLDLVDIGFVSSTEATFSGTTTSGVLTVTDGTHTAKIILRGNYTTSTFVASSDDHGGTRVTDPRVGAFAPPAHQFISAMAGLGPKPSPVATAGAEPWRGRAAASLLAPRCASA
jgi:hypothetical protein